MNPLAKTTFECSKCGAQFPKWQGRCSECGGWGTVGQGGGYSSGAETRRKSPPGKTIGFGEIKGRNEDRAKTGLEEFDQVLGGGIVPGSLTLIGGEPGIGKSTLVLQIAESISRSRSEILSDAPVLYVSGEESAEQIKMRMDRLELGPEGMDFMGEIDIDIICSTLEKARPKLAVIDSIQTMYSLEVPSAAGSINQVRVCTVKLLEQAKRNNIAIFIVGHVTKEGTVAGPKTLEHLVDTVLYLEGERYHNFRLLRTVKNRFGSTNEIGIFEMREKGLTEVKNPSEIFLQDQGEKASGSITSAVVEGNRVFLIEIQALVSKTYFGYPQRRASGFDINRLQLLIAVLSKRCGLNLGNQDILINVAGGIKITEPAIDLAISLAIASAFKNVVIDPKLVAFGEVGLGGEIRPVSQAEKRLAEAAKLGFENALIPETKAKLSGDKIKITRTGSLKDAIDQAIKNSK